MWIVFYNLVPIFNFWFVLTITDKNCLYRQCRPKSYVLKH